MSVTAVGNNVAGTDYQQYQKYDEVLFKTYSYKEGEGQEKIYYKKETVWSFPCNPIQSLPQQTTTRKLEVC